MRMAGKARPSIQGSLLPNWAIIEMLSILSQVAFSLFDLASRLSRIDTPPCWDRLAGLVPRTSLPSTSPGCVVPLQLLSPLV